MEVATTCTEGPAERRAAEAAKNLWEGHPQTMVDGTPLTIVSSNDKRLIAGWYGPQYQTSYYVPRQHHVPVIARGVRDLHPQHPAENLPGSVGCMQVRLAPDGTVHFSTLQGCFRIGHPPELHWNFLKPYLSWRQDLIRERLAALFEQIATIVFINEQKPGFENAIIFQKVVREFGFTEETREGCRALFRK